VHSVREERPKPNDQKVWDAYWEDSGYRGKWLYDGIAACYRQFIIRPALNYFVFRYFPSRVCVLHAGCGSGQVDVQISKAMHLTAIDISGTALRKYALCHQTPVNLLQGTIDRLPILDRSYDAIFNLGVMEHFKTAELERIFCEFNRVLKTSGKIILFWPPVYGLSVRVLAIVQRLLSRTLKNPVKLHPEEHTLVRSREQIEALLKLAGFVLCDYYFGVRDLFTHQVIVAEKVAETRYD